MKIMRYSSKRSRKLDIVLFKMYFKPDAEWLSGWKSDRNDMIIKSLLYKQQDKTLNGTLYLASVYPGKRKILSQKFIRKTLTELERVFPLLITREEKGYIDLKIPNLTFKELRSSWNEDQEVSKVFNWLEKYNIVYLDKYETDNTQ